MSVYDAALVNPELSKKTSIFGLHLWVVIGIVVGAVIVLILFLLSLCITACRRRRSGGKAKRRRQAKLSGGGEMTPVVSKEIQEIVHESAAADNRSVVPQVKCALDLILFNRIQLDRNFQLFYLSFFAKG